MVGIMKDYERREDYENKIAKQKHFLSSNVNIEAQKT